MLSELQLIHSLKRKTTVRDIYRCGQAHWDYHPPPGEMRNKKIICDFSLTNVKS